MKAIVNMNPASPYARFNGHTFPVDELLSHLVALTINGLTVDFTHTEVLIVDLEAEMQGEFDSFNWGNSGNKYNNLKAYCKTNNFITHETYNCPA